MDVTFADQLCADINARMDTLSFSFAEGERSHSLTLEGKDPIRFPLDAGGDVQGGSAAWVAKKHAGGQIHEPGMIAALLAISDHRPDVRTILDIGALYGYVSLVAGALFPGAGVHAFEANPGSFHALCRNIEANRPAAAHAAQAHLCVLSDASQRSTPLRIHWMQVADPNGAAGSGPGRVVELDVWSLDDYCRDEGLSPDLIKIDVEGYQAKIVPGAAATISRTRPIILLEFDSPRSVNYFGMTNRDVVAPLLRDGYQLVWGQHRSTDVPFRTLELDDLTDEHEMNSLGILVP